MNNEEWIYIFSNNLKNKMDSMGYTQGMFAEDIGVSRSTVNRYINGSQIPSAKVILNMSYILNCEVKDLIDFGDQVR